MFLFGERCANTELLIHINLCVPWTNLQFALDTWQYCSHHFAIHSLRFEAMHARKLKMSDAQKYPYQDYKTKRPIVFWKQPRGNHYAAGNKYCSRERSRPRISWINELPRTRLWPVKRTAGTAVTWLAVECLVSAALTPHCAGTHTRCVRARLVYDPIRYDLLRGFSASALIRNASRGAVDAKVDTPPLWTITLHGSGSRFGEVCGSTWSVLQKRCVCTSLSLFL